MKGPAPKTVLAPTAETPVHAAAPVRRASAPRREPPPQQAQQQRRNNFPSFFGFFR
jgi:hypothetical protein